MNETLPDAQKWMSLKIIQLALLSGATVFLLVCGVIIFSSTETTPRTDGNFIPFLALVGATWIVSQMVKMQLEVLLRRKLAGENPFNAYQTMIILRMALSEGPALFGLVGLLIFGPGTATSDFPKLLLFLLPYFSLLATGLLKMPSEDDFKDRVRVAKENKSIRR